MRNNKRDLLQEELVPLIGITSLKMTGDLKKPKSSSLCEFVINRWFDGMSTHHLGKMKHLFAQYSLCLILL